MTHWKALTNPDYIGAYAFQPGQEITATINTVKREVVVGSDGKREECTVIHFAEREIKPLILNATNGKMVSRVLGTPYIDNWSGKKIVMGVDKVKAFGELVDAVRVRNKKVSQAAAEIRCADCGKPIAPYGDKTPEWVSQYTKEKYGVCLCIECGMKRKEQEDGEKT